MNTPIVLPLSQVTRDFTNQLLSLFIETSRQGKPNAVVSHLLATFAPQTSQALPNIKDFTDYIRICEAFNAEMQPWLRKLIVAIFDDTVVENTEWGRANAQFGRLDELMAASCPMWDVDLRTDESTQVFDKIFDPMIMMVSAWWMPALRSNPWLLWFSTWLGGDLMIQSGEDYRVAEWHRAQETYNAAPKMICAQFVGDESSYDQVSEFVNSRYHDEVAAARKVALEEFLQSGPRTPRPGIRPLSGHSDGVAVKAVRVRELLNERLQQALAEKMEESFQVTAGEATALKDDAVRIATRTPTRRINAPNKPAKY